MRPWAFTCLQRLNLLRLYVNHTVLPLYDPGDENKRLAQRRTQVVQRVRPGRQPGASIVGIEPLRFIFRRRKA